METYLSFNQIKEKIAEGQPVLIEMNKLFNISGQDIPLNVSLEEMPGNPEYVKIRVQGEFVRKLENLEQGKLISIDRESKVSKVNFANLEPEAFVSAVKSTFKAGRNHTKEDIKPEQPGFFTGIGTALDKTMDDLNKKVSELIEKGSVSIDNMSKKLDEVKKDVLVSLSEAADLGAGVYNKAAQSQTKLNSRILEIKDRIRSNEEKLGELAADIRRLSDVISAEKTIAANKGIINEKESLVIEYLQSAVTVKMQEAKIHMNEIAMDKERLNIMAKNGKQIKSPAIAGTLAIYNSIGNILQEEYNTAKETLTSIGDKLKDLNARTIQNAKEIKDKVFGEIVNIGRAGLAITNSLEEKVTTLTKEGYDSLTKDYNHNAKVRSTVKNLVNREENREEIHKPELTQEEKESLSSLDKYMQTYNDASLKAYQDLFNSLEYEVFAPITPVKEAKEFNPENNKTGKNKEKVKIKDAELEK